MEPSYSEYWAQIREIAADLVSEHKGDEDAIQDALHETIDGHEYVIYTGKSLTNAVRWKRTRSRMSALSLRSMPCERTYKPS